MRRYWLPAAARLGAARARLPARAREAAGRGARGVPRHARPRRLLDERCPHRQASLFLGRNEDCGLRCVYHGWKFDVEGRCVDMMNEPEELRFAHKIRTGAYPTVEAGGLIWAYLGPAERRPPLAPLRVDAGAAHAPARLEGHPGDQLGAGPRGRHRHLARAHPAPRHRPELVAPRLQDDGSLRPRQGARPRARRHRLRLPLRGPAAARRTATSTCAPITSSCPSTRSARRAPALRPRVHRRGRPHLGADR